MWRKEVIGRTVVVGGLADIKNQCLERQGGTR